MKAFAVMLFAFVLLVGFLMVGGWLVDQLDTYVAGLVLLGALVVVVAVAVRKVLK